MLKKISPSLFTFQISQTVKHSVDVAVIARAMIVVLLVIPLISLSGKALSLAVYAVDLPYMDDWRELIIGRAGSLRLSHLFTPANDTLYPVGKILDSLFARLLSFNVIVYQVLSLVIVLGALLYLQYSLLSKTVHDRFVVAAAFSSTVLMLQPGSYWGLQFVAYHQAIPAVCLLAMLRLMLISNNWARNLGLVLLTLVAGFSYISGAFACCVVALVFLIHVPLLDEPLRTRSFQASILIGGAGSVALVAQLWVILDYQGGSTHRPDAPWGFPTELDFWAYILGKFGRALALPPQAPMFSLIATVAVLALSLVATVYVLRPTWRRMLSGRASVEQDAALQRLSLIVTSIAAAVGVYLVLVAAGRVNLRPAEIASVPQIFSFGFGRFHFFWINLLIPWLIVMVLLAVERLVRRPAARMFAPLALASLILVSSARNGVFDHASYYAETGRLHIANLNCINEQLRGGSGHILCDMAYPADLMTAYENAVALGATFTRYMPQPHDLPLPVTDDDTMFRLSAQESMENITVHNAAATITKGPMLLATGPDPQLVIALDAPAAQSCRVLQVTVTQAIEKPSHLQVFYLRAGDLAFSEESSSTVALDIRESRKTLFVRSDWGFQAFLRVDPVADAQTVRLNDIVVGCRERL